MADILIIDDDHIVCSTLCELVAHLGHRPTAAHTLAEGLQTARSRPFDVVFLDVRMPDGNGLDIVPSIRTTSSSPEIIIMTGYGDAEGAELAIKSGVWDYLLKPSSLQAMAQPLERALQYREQKQTGVSRAPTTTLKRESIVGNSPKMMACYELLDQAASSDVNVLIMGETGTGKELFASAIHNNSTRADHAFVVLDCAALPSTLVESVLFGHEKGAFTGAYNAREGLIQHAHGGTLFLDEVGEMPPSVQKAFLRVLQEHRFRPLGSRREQSSDFRVIAATNRNLEDMVRTGDFRQDLLFRLQTVMIELPPLRERKEDIRGLALYHMTRLCKRWGIGPKEVSPEFIDALSSYEWPGNVRELFNAIEKVFVAARYDSVLYPKHLPNHVRIRLMHLRLGRQESIERPIAPETSVSYPSYRDFRSSAIRQVEQEYLSGLLTLTGGNIPAACKISQLSQSRLYELLKKHNMTRSIRETT